MDPNDQHLHPSEFRDKGRVGWVVYSLPTFWREMALFLLAEF